MQAIEDSEKASIAKVLEENKVDFIKTSTGFILETIFIQKLMILT